MSTTIGRSVPRVDGHAKVTGAATYAADHRPPRLLHGYLVLSTIARGEVTNIDTREARAQPGVVAVHTHRDLPRIEVPEGLYLKGFVPMQDTRIHHNGQPVAYVVAETLEQAQEAANLVRVSYRHERPATRLADALDDTFLPPPFQGEPNEIARGNAADALRRADVRIEGRYTSPQHQHNAIEPHATTAVWEAGDLTLYESSQGVSMTRDTVAAAFGLPPERVRIVSPYLGGGFGAKGPVWAHTLLTAAAARMAGRPVKLVLSRAQLNFSVGHRSEYHHHIQLGATRQGRLTALVDTSSAQLSRTDQAIFNPSQSALELYACENVHARQLGAPLDLPTSTWMRSPETTAHFGLETAMDELSYEIDLDPVELRVRNHARTNQLTGERYASKHLLECYRMAAREFGWHRRSRRPGTWRDGDEHVGWGMATETHGYASFPSAARVTVEPDGRATLRCGTQDIGTGTYTIISQAAADGLGMPIREITPLLGDTRLPGAGISAVSATVASVIGPVARAAENARDKVIALAVADSRSPLHGARAEDVVAERGVLFVRDDRGRRESYRDVLSRHGKPIEAQSNVLGTPGRSFGAVFVEVRVHARLGTVRVSRVVGAYDPGRVLNHRTARSQVIGGVNWGIGFALLEETVVDPGSARVVNPNLSTYLIPVNPDAPPVEVLFVDRPDRSSNALGARGFGETPMTGVPAAIGNAIFHATGRRLRDVPFTQDRLLSSQT